MNPIASKQPVKKEHHALFVLAGEAIPAPGVEQNPPALYIGADGKAYLTDASDMTKINFAGFGMNGAEEDEEIGIKADGLMWGFEDLTLNAPVYLSETPGEITHTPPTNDVLVAAAKSSSTAIINTGIRFRRRTFATSSGTWTKYPGLRETFVRLVAPGGGAGAGDDTTSDTVGGGAGSGSWTERTFRPSELGSTENYTLGTPGQGETNNGSEQGNSTDAGTSTFGSHLTAPGGSRGLNQSNGSGGSTPTGGDFNCPGQNGDPGGLDSKTNHVPRGGRTPFGEYGRGGDGGGASDGSGGKGGNGQQGFIEIIDIF